MIAENNYAPDFISKNENNEPVGLADFKGKNLVLYFYAKDNTPSCSKEAVAFKQLHSKFERRNTAIAGVSVDSVASHQKFKQKYELPFQLLSDENQQLAKLFKVWKEKSMYGKKYMGVERTTFVIDENGVIRKIFPKVRVPNHAEAVLEFVELINKTSSASNFDREVR